MKLTKSTITLPSVTQCGRKVSDELFSLVLELQLAETSGLTTVVEALDDRHQYQRRPPCEIVLDVH